MRKLFFVLALFFSWTLTQAQTQGRELTSRGITDSTQVFVPSNGSTLAYILQADAWRVWIDGVKTNPFKTGNNGITGTFNNLQMGGPLIKNTQINTGNFDLIFADDSGNGLSLFDSSGFILQSGSNSISASSGINISSSNLSAGHPTNAKIIVDNSDVWGGSVKITGSSSGVINIFDLESNDGKKILNAANDKIDIGVPHYELVNLNSHGLSAYNWLTVNSSGALVKGSDPGSQPFIGLVTRIVDANNFTYASPGSRIDGAGGLTAGVMYYAQNNGTIGSTSSPKPVLIATSSSSGILLSGSFGATLQPPSPSGQIQFTNITSTGVTVTVSRGNGNGVLILIGETITELPQTNTYYNGNANFGDGDDIGSTEVVYVGDENSVVVTGLTANTYYQVVGFEFSASGQFITYNTASGANSFTTLADASTPTQQWITTNKKSKETSIQITGIRGNGDNIVAVASILGPPDTDPVDGVDYTADTLGNGSALGNGWVVYKGTSTNFNINGLTRDRKVYWKVYEREDTGFLYNRQTNLDSVYTAFIYEGGAGAFAEGSGTPAGQVYLTALAGTDGAWYKFSNLTTADEVNVANADAGLEDISAGTATATVLGVPVTNEIDINGTRKSARTASTSAISTNTDGDAWFNTSTGFELHWSGQVSDGRAGTSGQFTSFYGTLSNSSQVHFRVFDSGTAQVNVRDGVQTSATNWAASNFLNDGVQTVVIQVRVDFVNDLITFYKDGVVFPSAYQSGAALSAQDFTNFNGTSNFVIGNFSNSGSLSGNTNGTTVSTAQFAITPLLTTQQRADIYSEFAFTATAGAAFVNFDVTETDSYTQETLSDSLSLVGSAPGFDNYMEHTLVIPDSLQEVEIGFTFKIRGALTTDPSGIGPMIKNDDSEANYRVMGQMSMDTDAGSFGKLEIFSGNGTIDFDDVSIRSQSSGAFVPAEDSTYQAVLRGTLLNNDSFWSITIKDLYDSVLLTTAFTSPDRPLSAFFGSTTHAGIWFQGPNFRIGEFWVVRIGTNVDDSTDPPPAPEVGNAYAVVGGAISGDCDVEVPCDLQTAMAKIASLGGSDRVLIVGPGEHILTSYLIVPTNLGLMLGAGKTQTKISGASNLNNTYGYLSSDKALLQALSSTSTDVTTHIKGMTISGGQAGSRLKNNGLFVRNRNGFTLEDIRFEYFNSASVWFQATTGVTISDINLINCDFIEGAGGSGDYDGAGPGISGVQNPATGYPPVGSVGNSGNGAVMLHGNVDGFTFDGSNSEAITWGTGYLVKGGGPVPHSSNTITQQNIILKNLRMRQHPEGWCSNGPNFAIEFHDGLNDAEDVFGDLLIDSCYFENGAVSLVSANTSANEGNHIISNTDFNNLSTLPWFIEDQTQNLEVYNCYFRGPRVWCGFAGGVGFVKTNHRWHHNLIELGQSPTVTHRFVSTNGRYSNGLFDHNVFVFLSNAGSKWEFMYLAPRASTNVTFTAEDNVFLNDNPGDANPYRIDADNVDGVPGGFSGCNMRYNFSTHLNVNQVISGVTTGNNTQGGTGSTWFNFLGLKWPVATGNYYATPVSSPLRDAGNGGDDVGIYEHSLPFILLLVHIRRRKKYLNVCIKMN